MFQPPGTPPCPNNLIFQPPGTPPCPNYLMFRPIGSPPCYNYLIFQPPGTPPCRRLSDTEGGVYLRTPAVGSNNAWFSSSPALYSSDLEESSSNRLNQGYLVG